MLLTGVIKKTSLKDPRIEYGIWNPPARILDAIKKINDRPEEEMLLKLADICKIILKEMYISGKKVDFKTETMNISGRDYSVLSDESEDFLTPQALGEIFIFFNEIISFPDEKKI